MGYQALKKMPWKPLMSELNTKNTLVSLMVVVKDLKALHGSGEEVQKQKQTADDHSFPHYPME